MSPDWLLYIARIQTYPVSRSTFPSALRPLSPSLGTLSGEPGPLQSCRYAALCSSVNVMFRRRTCAFAPCMVRHTAQLLGEGRMRAAPSERTAGCRAESDPATYVIRRVEHSDGVKNMMVFHHKTCCWSLCAVATYSKLYFPWCLTQTICSVFHLYLLLRIAYTILARNWYSLIVRLVLRCEININECDSNPVPERGHMSGRERRLPVHLYAR